MNAIFEWDSGFFPSVVTLSLFIVCYFSYWFISQSARLEAFCRRTFKGEDAQANYILLQRVVGIIFLGVVPVIALTAVLGESLGDYGIARPALIPTLYWIGGISVGLLPLVLSFSRKPEFYRTYPLIRKKIWDTRQIFTNTLSWIVYLLAYEFFFRGFLLTTCWRLFGSYPAIFINVSLYFCVHIPYGFWVSLGAIPLGIAMCFATLHTGGIWAAFAVHLLVALLNDYVALGANPDINVMKRGS